MQRIKGNMNETKKIGTTFKKNEKWNEKAKMNLTVKLCYL